MNVTINIDLEKLRYSLVGDGYCLKEVLLMSNESLIDILERRVNSHINVEYYRSVDLNLLDVTIHEWEPKPLEPILEPLIRKELEEVK